MKQFTFLLTLMLIFLVLGSACKKTTTVSGIVTNNSTGLPMEGVKVGLSARKSGEPGKADVNVAKDTTTTNAKGEYGLEVEACNSKYVLLYITKVEQGKFALPVYRYLSNGDCKNIDLFLNQYDAYLKLVFENHYSFSGNVFCYFDGPALEDNNMPAGDWPRNVPLGEASSETFLVPSNASLYVIWDTLNLGTKMRGLDSITCIPNDTTTYVLRF